MNKDENLYNKVKTLQDELEKLKKEYKIYREIYDEELEQLRRKMNSIGGV